MQCIRCGKEMFTSAYNGDNICFECRNSYNNSHIHIPNNCDIPLPQGFGKQEGWICPVCGRGLAPWTSFCPCQGSEMKITYGTSLGTEGMNSMQDYYEQWIKQHDSNFDGELKS